MAFGLRKLKPIHNCNICQTLSNSMKTIFALLTVLLTATLVTSAQGLINFANNPPVPDAPVFDVDGTTRLEGPRYRAQLWAGPSEESLSPVGVWTPFLTGEGAGYFVGGVRTIVTVPLGTIATVQVVAWDTFSGATYEEAAIRGRSPVFTVLPGDPFIGNPAPLVGLQSFSLIPEPSSGLLFCAGAGILFLGGRFRVYLAK
jgi:hypothetical protein